ncbi:MAG: chorismate mutase [Lachnospiraceae bacterium]|nr:chorismate mutase [Lachnospiraceae bacterium]MBR6999444.1 chorismate mutase [Lachnospiraceae bacterium]MCR5530360.1 chorismate mutase [Lachnospiraceae bacterium]
MKSLEECRMEIEKLDSKIVDLLVRRIYVTNEMAEAKKKQNLPVYDQLREDLLRRRVRQLAGAEYEEIVSAVYETIIQESKKQQMQRFFE